MNETAKHSSATLAPFNSEQSIVDLARTVERRPEKLIPLATVIPLLGWVAHLLKNTQMSGANGIDPMAILVYDEAAAAAGWPLAREILDADYTISTRTIGPVS